LTVVDPGWGRWYEVKGWLIPFLAAALLMVTSAPAFSDGGSPVVRIDPVESTTVTVGESFTVSVMIDDANDLGAFQFDLLYISTIVTVDDVTLGGFLGSTGRTLVPLDPTIDNDAGRLTFGAASYGSNPGPEGTGTLALITLTGRGEGVSSLELQRIWVMDTGGNRQTFTGEDGSFEVIGPTAVTLSSFAARSSAGVEGPFIWPWLVGVAMLAGALLTK
jgi:hypothetical protein